MVKTRELRLADFTSDVFKGLVLIETAKNLQAAGNSVRHAWLMQSMARMARTKRITNNDRLV